MFAIVLVIIQFLILTFIGGFARTTLAYTTSSYFLGTNILFLLTWTLMNAPYKKLTLHSLTILLLATAFTFECNLLFGRFWYSLFNQFSTSYELTIQMIIEGSIACFVVLLVMIDYIGIFRYWQIYLLLVPIINFGWSLNYTVLRYGLKIFDGGMANGFLYAGVVSIVIWIVSVRSKHEKFGGYNSKNGNSSMRPDIYIRQEYYNGYSISLLGGLIGTFFLWPSLNSSTSLLSGSLTIVSLTIKNSSLFQNSAYSNTILCLCVGTVSSFILLNRDRIGESKHRIRCTIDCFINAGIICAYFVDISLNPASVMAMSLISTLLTLILYLYYQRLQSESNKIDNLSNFMILLMYYARALFRIILPLLGSIVAAIVVANRQYTSELLDTATYGTTIYSKTAGLQVAAYFVTLGISIVGGVLCGLAVNLFLYVKEYYPTQNQQLLKSKLNSKLKQNKLDLQNTNNTKLEYSPEKLGQSELTRLRKNHQEKYLTDLDFLELDQHGSDMFPLFLRPEDKYVDEEETARKMLKEAILSHVKNNYISTQNYISVNKNNNKNMNTNNTLNQGDNQFETRPDPRRKLDFSLEADYVLKNNQTKSPTRREYANRVEAVSPKSAKSKIRNQVQQIEDQNRKGTLGHANAKQPRQAMPEFYIDHIRGSKEKTRPRDDSFNSKVIQSNAQMMNRSKTQKYLAQDAGQDKDPRKSKAFDKNVDSVMAYSKRQSGNPQIKKTQSMRETISNRQPNQLDKKVNNFSIISELEREEDEKKSKEIASKLGRSSKQVKKQGLVAGEERGGKQVEDDGSFILDENQHEVQSSQIL